LLVDRTVLTVCTDFEERLVRAAVARIVIETFRSTLWTVATMAIIAAGGFVYAYVAAPESSRIVLGAAIALAAAALFWGAIVVLNYMVTLRDSVKMFREMENQSVEFKLAGDDLLISSAAWSGKIPWNSTSRLVCRRSFWLVGLGRTRIGRGCAGNLEMRSAFGNEILSGESALKLWRFPILWARPGMSLMFVVFPIAGVSKDALAFLADRIGPRAPARG